MVATCVVEGEGRRGEGSTRREEKEHPTSKNARPPNAMGHVSHWSKRPVVNLGLEGLTRPRLRKVEDMFRRGKGGWRM